MLVRIVESYLAVRRACGFELKTQENFLRSFTIYSNDRGKNYVCSEVAIERAGLAHSVHQRARRLGHVIRFARYARLEDQSHELSPAVFGSENRAAVCAGATSPHASLVAPHMHCESPRNLLV